MVTYFTQVTETYPFGVPAHHGENFINFCHDYIIPLLILLSRKGTSKFSIYFFPLALPQEYRDHEFIFLDLLPIQPDYREINLLNIQSPYIPSFSWRTSQPALVPGRPRNHK